MTVDERLINQMVLDKGARNSSVIEVSNIYFDPELRKACEQNQCGNYGKNYTCPPLCGDVNELIARAKKYSRAIIFQTIYDLEDSYDYEGMEGGRKSHNEVVKSVFLGAKEMLSDNVLVLGAGGCSECEICAKREEKPCRHPDVAFASLEAYGMYVTKMAEQGNMKYINGKNTVTYFGLLLF